MDSSRSRRSKRSSDGRTNRRSNRQPCSVPMLLCAGHTPTRFRTHREDVIDAHGAGLFEYQCRLEMVPCIERFLQADEHDVQGRLGSSANTGCRERRRARRGLLRVRKYVEAAKLARHCAESERNPHAKQILQEIERSYYRLVEIETWMVDQQQHNRPFAHFGLFNGHDARTCFAMRDDIVSPSADQKGSPDH
jgi:hypothetical protein